MQVQRVAHAWTEFFEFATADNAIVQEALGDEHGSGSWTASFQGGGSTSAVDATILADLMKEMVTKAVNDQVPNLTVRNHKQLCEAQGTRTFCLFLVDDADGSQSAKALREVKSSKEAYAQELIDLRSGDEGGDEETSTEESFNIQVVRVMTSSSRWPWHPVAVGAGFDAIWSQAKYAKTFVYELETRKLAAVKTPSLQEIFQQIAYEDLQFVDTPETSPLLSALPDPEVRLKRELSRFLGSLPGAVIAYLCMAAVMAAAPEFPMSHVGALVAVMLSLLIAAWPVAFRKCVGAMWCLTSPSRFECQV